MTDLNDDGLRLLRTIADAPLAWLTPAQVAESLGDDLDATLDRIAGLDASGWLDPWEIGGTLHVTLSALAVERLRLRLEPIGRSGSYRWASLDDPEPPFVHAGGRPHEGMTSLDFVADPAPGPEALAEAAERVGRISAAKREAGDPAWLDWLPRPRLLLGQGLTPWPGPLGTPSTSGLPCPACGSAPIDDSAYCLVCDRWGLDHILLAHRQRRRTGPTAAPSAGTPSIQCVTPKPPTREAEAAAKAKAARKARRRRRLRASEGA